MNISTPSKEERWEALMDMLKNTTIPDQPSINQEVIEFINNIDWSILTPNRYIDNFDFINEKDIVSILEVNLGIESLHMRRGFNASSEHGVFINTLLGIKPKKGGCCVVQQVVFRTHDRRTHYVGSVVSEAELVGRVNPNEFAFNLINSKVGINEAFLNMFMDIGMNKDKKAWDFRLPRSFIEKLFAIEGKIQIFKVKKLSQIKSIHCQFIEIIGEEDFLRLIKLPEHPSNKAFPEIFK